MPLKNQNNAGFTLIEMLVTIVILAIVLAFAVPSFQMIIQENRITSQTNSAASLVNFARSEASKMPGAMITVCTTSDNSSCSSSSAWEDGWLVMRDVDGDRSVDTGDGDEVLKVSPGFTGGNTLRISGLTSGGGSYVQFGGNGLPVESSGGSAAGTFVVCDERGASDARGIVVGVSGQVRMARDSDDDGTLNDHNGNNLTCP